jgi:hypothetical protein
MRRGDIGTERMQWRSGQREVEMWGWSEPHGMWDGEALEDGYEGGGQSEASMWEAELEALLEAESAGIAVEVGQAGQAGQAGQVVAFVEAAREEDGSSPS